MKFIKTFLSLLFLFTMFNAHAQIAITEAPPKPDFGDGVVNPALAAKAEAIVKKWFEALVYNDTAQLKKLTGFPFAWDRVEIIADEKVFIKKFNTNNRENKQREIEEAKKLLKTLTVKVIDSKRSIIDNIIPIDAYIIHFSTKEGNTTHGGRIAVQMTPEPKVIGLSD